MARLAMLLLSVSLARDSPWDCSSRSFLCQTILSIKILPRLGWAIFAYLARCGIFASARQSVSSSPKDPPAAQLAASSGRQLWLHQPASSGPALCTGRQPPNPHTEPWSSSEHTLYHSAAVWSWSGRWPASPCCGGCRLDRQHLGQLTETPAGQEAVWTPRCPPSVWAGIAVTLGSRQGRPRSFSQHMRSK